MQGREWHASLNAFIARRFVLSSLTTSRGNGEKVKRRQTFFHRRSSLRDGVGFLLERRLNFAFLIETISLTFEKKPVSVRYPYVCSVVWSKWHVKTVSDGWVSPWVSPNLSGEDEPCSHLTLMRQSYRTKHNFNVYLETLLAARSLSCT